jgi:hypothetical protein
MFLSNKVTFKIDTNIIVSNMLLITRLTFYDELSVLWLRVFHEFQLILHLLVLDSEKIGNNVF